MRQRKLPLGNMNIVGANITNLRVAKGIKQKDLLAKLQAEGMEITASGLSKKKAKQGRLQIKSFIL